MNKKAWHPYSRVLLFFRKLLFDRTGDISLLRSFIKLLFDRTGDISLLRSFIKLLFDRTGDISLLQSFRKLHSTKPSFIPVFSSCVVKFGDDFQYLPGSVLCCATLLYLYRD
ncbi:hypothetical protein [Bacillus sp. B-jedd]|uniref:hypothetical protein n=1 Tax=Bacillus sp. B-jedd TaxID=1476857 RepID=UPI0011DE4087|nr:hypothetical protein [Bacillus sp. B-jedd]